MYPRIPAVSGRDLVQEAGAPSGCGGQVAVYKIEHAVGAGHFTRAYLATDIESNTKARAARGRVLMAARSPRAVNEPL
eukprot:Skav216740  [mRNA]  locus=scaffold178:40914:42118:+ [translate_table: standard]